MESGTVLKSFVFGNNRYNVGGGNGDVGKATLFIYKLCLRDAKGRLRLLWPTPLRVITVPGRTRKLDLPSGSDCLLSIRRSISLTTRCYFRVIETVVGVVHTLRTLHTRYCGTLTLPTDVTFCCGFRISEREITKLLVGRPNPAVCQNATWTFYDKSESDSNVISYSNCVWILKF